MSGHARPVLDCGRVHPLALSRLIARLARLTLNALVVLSCVGIPNATGSPIPTEYEVRAALLFNFMKFTRWPSSACTNGAPLVVGVVGEDPFGHTLDDLVRGESVGGRPLVVKRFEPGQDFSACHLLFVSRSEAGRLPAVLETLRAKPVLSVGEFDRFCEQGGMGTLVLSAEGKVKLEINPQAARDAGLRVSSRLLNLRVVRLVGSDP